MMALLMVVYEPQCCRGRQQSQLLFVLDKLSIEFRRQRDKELRQVRWMMWITCMYREFILVSTNYIVIGDTKFLDAKILRQQKLHDFFNKQGTITNCRSSCQINNSGTRQNRPY
jgi:hypothetical protein